MGATVSSAIGTWPVTIQAQIAGAVIFGISAALYGKVAVKAPRVEQSNFHNYRVLRMNEAPTTETHMTAIRKTRIARPVEINFDLLNRSPHLRSVWVTFS